MFEPRGHASARSQDMEPDAPVWDEWVADEATDENWLVSYADMLSVILAMVVLLLGRMVMAGAAAPKAPPEPAAIAEVSAPAPEAVPPDADDLLLPSPAAGRTVSGVVDTSLSLRLLPDWEVLVSPSASSALAFVALMSTARPIIDDLDLPPGPPGPLEVLDAGSSNEAAARSDADVGSPGRRLADLVEQRFRGTIEVRQQETGVLLTIADVVLFDTASAKLAPDALRMLEDLSVTLREAGDAQVSVEGHTDDRPVHDGEFASNWDLAAARANAVTRFLLTQGFDSQRVHSVSYADTRPVADNATSNGRAANRRVELRIEFVENERLGLASDGRAAQVRGLGDAPVAFN